MKVSIIFKDKPDGPGAWGLRGDPYFWDFLENYFSYFSLPFSEKELEDKIISLFSYLTGQKFDIGKNAYCEQFSHGGMSSGYICCEKWIELIALLKSRLSLANENWYCKNKTINDYDLFKPNDVLITRFGLNQLINFACDDSAIVAIQIEDLGDLFSKNLITKIVKNGRTILDSNISRKDYCLYFSSMKNNYKDKLTEINYQFPNSFLFSISDCFEDEYYIYFTDSIYLTNGYKYGLLYDCLLIRTNNLGIAEAYLPSKHRWEIDYDATDAFNTGENISLISAEEALSFIELN